MGGEPEKESDNPMRSVPDWRRTMPLAHACARCGARTRSGAPCLGPAVAGSERCRMHGGGKSSGAPIGPANGQWRHGLRSAETVGRRRLAAAEGRELRRLIAELKAETKRLREVV